MPKKPVTDPHKAWNIQHYKRLEQYNKRIEKLLNDAIGQAALIVGRHNGEASEDHTFSFSDDRQMKAEADKLMKELAEEIAQYTKGAETKEWETAYKQATEYIAGLYGVVEQTQQRQNIFLDRLLVMKSRNMDALESFQKRKIGGLKLSSKVWDYTKDFERQMEAAIDTALLQGKSAEALSRDIRSLLKDPDALFRRVRDENDELRMSKAMEAFHPGPGKYRSAYKNAMRLARSEINMAYRSSDCDTAQSMDCVVGIRVNLSNNHTCNGKPFVDICDELSDQNYPKDFKFTGWHPQCYDDKSEVYTAEGWKFFKDVKDDDLILSLNPETRNLEYTSILLNISRHHNGKMVHFHNRSYSQFVTPEHEVLVVSKKDGRTFRRVEAERCGISQPIYRSSEWKGRKMHFVDVGKHIVPFEPFARFMGYWLSDGSLGHRYEISVAQQDDDRARIYDCIAELGMKPRYNGGKIEFNDRDWYEYLLQFGKAADKFVPIVIKESDAEGIRIFLDAFISCDGHIKKAKPFVGNRGGLCVPKDDERTYCTTSKRMADDIGELILKIGRRPSFRVSHTAGKRHQFRNGIYTINNDCIVISECRSQYATQYQKDIVDYDGMVYDLTLERNNTMYIRRDGKCFWGSNCRCFITYILKTDEEFWRDLEDGVNRRSVNTVDDVPDAFKEWVGNNEERIARAEERGTMPYFLRDNESVWKNETSQSSQEIERPISTQEKADIRHATRTKQERDKIIHDYDSHRIDKLTDKLFDIVIEKRVRVSDDLFSYVDEIKTDIQNGGNHALVRDKLDKLSRVLTLYDKPQEGVLDYARGYALRSDVITDLLFKAREASGTDLEAIKNQLIEKCAVATRRDLRKLGYIKGLSYEGVVRDHRIGSDFRLTINGKDIEAKSFTMDFVRFKDNSGFEYYYPISSEKRDFLFNASKISERMETYNSTSFIRQYTTGVMSVNKANPYDVFYREVYRNFDKGAMYSFDQVTVHTRYTSIDDFLSDLTHESAHHFDESVFPKKSATTEWIEAAKKDVAFPTPYAQDAHYKDYMEDFADSVKEYYKNRSKFTKEFPNRAALLDEWL